MTMIEMIPQEFFDAVPVPPAVTMDGELLAALDEAPAGPWLAEMLAGVDMIRRELPTLRLLVIDPDDGRLLYRATSSYPVGPTVIGNLIPYDRPWHNGKTKSELSVTIDHNGHVTMTTVSGQTRTVTPYDHRMTAADDDESGDR